MSASPQPEKVLVVLEAELKRLRDGAFEAWKIYISWYTWFFGGNLLVLGWVLTRKAGVAETVNVAVLAAAGIVFNLSAIVATLRLQSFTREVARRAAAICEQINAAVRDMGVTAEMTSGFAGRFGNWGAGANAVMLFGNVAVWLYVLLRLR